MDWTTPAIPMPLWSNSDYYRRLIIDEGWIAEPKADGWRCLIWVDGIGSAITLSKNQRTISTGLDFGCLAAVPHNTLLDGEWVKSKGELLIWDSPSFPGRLIERWERLKCCVPRFGAVRLVTRLPKAQALQSALAAGHEGIVLKEATSYYPDGKTCQWLKVKG